MPELSLVSGQLVSVLCLESLYHGQESRFRHDIAQDDPAGALEVAQATSLRRLSVFVHDQGTKCLPIRLA